MTIFDFFKENFPDLEVMVNEMKAIQTDWQLLPKEYAEMNVKNIPCYIMTFNRSFGNQPTYNHMRDHSHIVFVCSTDDPYLEKFKEECTEEILVFDKADYVYTDEENGDTHGLEYPYNQCGVFARRFLDDYTQKNNIKRFIVADNDLKMSVKMCDRKTLKFDDYPYAVDFAIQLYFYLLEKYDFLQYVTATNAGIEMMGKMYDIGFYFLPASLNFHLSSKPCRWISRFSDDFITSKKILEIQGRLSLNLPIIRINQASIVGKGDMSRVYKAAYEEHKDSPLMKDCTITDEAERGVRTVLVVYNENFYPGSTKNGRLQHSAVLRSILEKRSSSL